MATWLPVPQWEGFYEVSDQGQVRSVSRTYTNSRGHKCSVKGRTLTPTPNSGGYNCVALSRQGERLVKPVHILVALAFIGPKPDGLETCHNDGNKLNNAVTNLRYDTHRSNVMDAMTHKAERAAKKSHCKHGHEYTGWNTARTATGSPVCRTCRRLQGQAHRARARAA